MGNGQPGFLLGALILAGYVPSISSFTSAALVGCESCKWGNPMCFISPIATPMESPNLRVRSQRQKRLLGDMQRPQIVLFHTLNWLSGRVKATGSLPRQCLPVSDASPLTAVLEPAMDKNGVNASATVQSAEGGSSSTALHTLRRRILVVREGLRRAILMWLGKFLQSRDAKNKDLLLTAGASAVLSYGFVSHITYSSCIVVAWVMHGLRTGLSPFSEGQWIGFFAAYLGLCGIQFWTRPFRLASAVFLAPMVDKAVEAIHTTLPISRKSSWALFVGGFNVVLPLLVLHSGLRLGTSFAGTPLFPPLAEQMTLEVKMLAVLGSVVGQVAAGPMGSIAGIMFLYEFKWWRIFLSLVFA